MIVSRRNDRTQLPSPLEAGLLIQHRVFGTQHIHFRTGTVGVVTEKHEQFRLTGHNRLPDWLRLILLGTGPKRNSRQREVIRRHALAERRCSQAATDDDDNGLPNKSKCLESSAHCGFLVQSFRVSLDAPPKITCSGRTPNGKQLSRIKLNAKSDCSRDSRASSNQVICDAFNAHRTTSVFSPESAHVICDSAFETKTPSPVSVVMCLGIAGLCCTLAA